MDPRFRDNPASQSALWADAAARGGFDVDVPCLRIGGLALAGIPGEAQVGFGREVQQASPFPLTRCVGVTNHACAYLFHEDARARGGYEADPQQWGMATGEGLPRILAAIREGLAECNTHNQEKG